jgi:hypothetical protein
MKLEIDMFSYKVGMINCFVEMVACGVKKLGISSPMTPAEFEQIESASDKIVKAFGVKSYLEKDMLVTALASEDFTKDKWSILYYKDDDVLKAFLALKEKKASLEELGKYDKSAYEDISREFMKLLSYPDDVIEGKISRTEPESPYLLAGDEQ